MKTILHIILCLFISFIGCSKDKTPAEIIDDEAVPLSSNYRYSEIESYAESIDSTVKLNYISGAVVNYNGCSEKWIFRFRSDLLSDNNIKYYFISSANNLINCDSIFTGRPTDGDSYITMKWINSDKAMEIAEKAGGTKFRQDNPAYNITASLGEAVVPNSQPYWYITYQSSNDKTKKIIISINAVTGTVKL